MCGIFFKILFGLVLLGGPLTSANHARAFSLPIKIAATSPLAAPAPTDVTPAPPVDPLGRSTPRGMVTGFLDAVGKEDFDKAAQYLDLSKYSDTQKKLKGAALAKDLQMLLDRGGWIYPTSMLSNDREGRKDDEAASDDIDTVGNLRGNGEMLDIQIQRVKDEDDNDVWLISAPTLAGLPAIVGRNDLNSEVPLDRILPNWFVETKLLGAPVGHWLAAITLLFLSYLSSWVIVLGLCGILKKVWTRKSTVSGIHILDAVKVPLSLYAAVWIFGFASIQSGISIIVRQHLVQLNVIVAWIAIALFLWRMIDLFTNVAQTKLIAKGKFFGFSSILFFIRRMAKVIFGVVILFIILDNLGVNVTAGLAALGLGGIALALGAQKTLENFIGSIAIIIDQPLHIGDYCKVGDAAGTVEDIGMRSTRLRTNDRTLITIPNGDLSTQRIENYARRNRYLIGGKFFLRYDTTPEKIQAFITKVQEIFWADETVDEGGRPARLVGFGENGFAIELFVYVNKADYNEFVTVQEKLLLQIIQASHDLGVYFAIPAQTFLPALDQLSPPQHQPPVQSP